MQIILQIIFEMRCSFQMALNICNKIDIELYLEVGPNPVLVSLAKQTNTNANALWLSSAKKDEDDVLYFHKTCSNYLVQELLLTGISFIKTKK
jgi:acyl transferase domain-containing protein